MKAFFDTNVYINAFFKGQISRQDFEFFFKIYDIWLCPIVKHELLLGTIHAKTKLELKKFFEDCPTFEAPDIYLWSKATELMREMKWKENKHQNDVLIALTAQKEEAVLITYDKIYSLLQKKIYFPLQTLKEKTDFN